MSVHIAGMGWVTPLGSGLAEVWEQICAGKKPTLEEIAGPSDAKPHSCFRVPPAALEQLPAHPRLRRASAISRFAAAAAMASLGQARQSLGEIDVSRLAVVFADFERWRHLYKAFLQRYRELWSRRCQSPFISRDRLQPARQSRRSITRRHRAHLHLSRRRRRRPFRFQHGSRPHAKRPPRLLPCRRSGRSGLALVRCL